jgi:hypothetical protein
VCAAIEAVEMTFGMLGGDPQVVAPRHQLVARQVRTEAPPELFPAGSNNALRPMLSTGRFGLGVSSGTYSAVVRSLRRRSLSVALGPHARRERAFSGGVGSLRAP